MNMKNFKNYFKKWNLSAFTSFGKMVPLLFIFYSCDQATITEFLKTQVNTLVKNFKLPTFLKKSGQFMGSTTTNNEQNSVDFKLETLANNLVVMRDGKEATLKKGEVLRKGDILKVGEKEFTLINFAEGPSQIKILASSEIKLESNEGPSVFSIPRGGVYVNFSSIDKEKGIDLHFKFPKTILRVQGTQFMAFTSDKDAQLRVAVLEGVVSVESSVLQKQFAVKKGEGVLVDAKGMMEKPSATRWVKSIPWMEVAKGTDTLQLQRNLENLAKVWRKNVDHGKNGHSQDERHGQNSEGQMARSENEGEAVKAGEAEHDTEHDREGGEKGEEGQSMADRIRAARGQSGDGEINEDGGGAVAGAGREESIEEMARPKVPMIKVPGQKLIEKAIGLDDAVSGLSDHFKQVDDVE